MVRKILSVVIPRFPDGTPTQTFFELLKPIIKMSIYSKDDISLGSSLNNLGVDNSLINPIISRFTKNDLNFRSKKKLKKLYLNESFILKNIYNKVLFEDEYFYLACDYSNKFYLLIEFNSDLTIIKFNSCNYFELKKGTQALVLYYQCLGVDPTFIMNIFNKNIQLYPPEY